MDKLEGISLEERIIFIWKLKKEWTNVNVDWIRVDQGGIQCRALVKMLIELLVP
jgi:hypothetical protein